MIPLKKKPIPRRVAGTASIPAPTGGLNAKDPIANMDESEATIMENWFPTPSDVTVRNGYAQHKTGLGAAVETLMAYNIGATQKLFGIADGDIYDVTTAGAVGAAAVSSLTNSRFQYATLGTSGGYFLLAVNGADKMQIYTGSAWDVDGGGYTVTGLDTATAIHINVFKNRVWLVVKNTLDPYYLGVSSIAGTATKFPLAALFKHGGYLMAMANWTIDNAAGVDDYAAFITSEGEIAIYRGTDPASADTWALVGTFRMGRPIGRRCAIKVGSDVLLMTEDGAFPLSKALLTDRSQTQNAVTDKIRNLIKTDIASNVTKFGWQPILHPFGNKLIINVPTQENSISHQYVMNTIHGAWCKFTGWDANCFELLGSNLYFGGDEIVYQADTGEDDDDSNIETNVQQAFSYFGSKGVVKKFNSARPIFLTSGTFTPALVLNVDYEERVPQYAPSFTSGGAPLWNTATWDVDSWAIGDTLSKKWQSVSGVGYSAGIRIKTSAKNITISWVSTDFIFEQGGAL